MSEAQEDGASAPCKEEIEVGTDPIDEREKNESVLTGNSGSRSAEAVSRPGELFKPYNVTGDCQIDTLHSRVDPKRASEKEDEVSVDITQVRKRPQKVLLPERSNKHECSYCKKQFTWKFKLTKHMTIHKQKNQIDATDNEGEKEAEREKAETEEQPELNIDNYGVESNFNITDEVEAVECEVNLIEGNSVPQNSSLKINNHTGEYKKIQCKICNKEFNQTGNLTIHMRIHTGETPYECPFCNKKFRASGDLTRHLRIHTGETPYECTVCGKKFTQRGPLTTHMRIHTGETPYGCPICNKKFNRNGTLTKHMRMHTGETPYECTVCTMKFKDSSKLRRHMRLHTEMTRLAV